MSGDPYPSISPIQIHVEGVAIRTYSQTLPMVLALCF